LIDKEGNGMAKIILIQALPASRLDSRENLTRAFDYYLPVVGVNTAATVVEIAGRPYPLQGGRSFAIQPPAPGDNAALARQVRAWDNLAEWIVRCGGETEAIITVNLDLDGPRRWRPVIRERFGIKG
jgi:hypothetical protein